VVFSFTCSAHGLMMRFFVLIVALRLQFPVSVGVFFVFLFWYFPGGLTFWFVRTWPDGVSIGDLARRPVSYVVKDRLFRCRWLILG